MICYLRSLKNRLYRYFSDNKTLNWVENVQHIADGINSSICRTIKMRPNDVSFKNASELKERVFGERPFEPKDAGKAPALESGDAVRLARERGAFDKGYAARFSDNVYRIG